MTNAPIILFDGFCNLCTGAVLFIIQRDRHAGFMFASLQSEFGQQLSHQHGINFTAIKTMVLIEGETAYTRSDAALRVARSLGGPWKAMACFLLLPRCIRDWVYHMIASNRSRWFGRQEECWIPKSEFADRFLH